jgi:hypothetical protein
MRGLLVLLLAVSACAPAPPAPRHELILDVTNNRADPLTVRVEPRALPQGGVPGQVDTGNGEGIEVAGMGRRTLRLSVTTDPWSITVNGDPILTSSEHDFTGGEWTAGRLVVDPEEASLELDRAEPMPSG